MLSVLLIIGVILFVLWLLGLFVGFIAGPFLWILIVLAIIFLIIWLVQRVRIGK